MASYFDIEPRDSATKSSVHADEEGEGNSKEYDEAYGRFGLLSPQVARILDDLELHDQSSGSDNDDEDEQSERSLNRHQGEVEASDAGTKGHDNSRGKATSTLNKSITSTPSSSSKLRKALTPNDAPDSTGTSPKITEIPRTVPKSAKQPHFARFQSLRSMLFSSRIEENMEKSKREEAEQRWKKEFQSRKGLERPKTPEKESGAGTSGEGGEEKDETKERGVMKRMGSKLKRLGSKDVQTMDILSEGKVVDGKHAQQNKTVDVRHDTGNESTASSDGEEASERRQSEDINQADIEDLVRWVSRRDPPSDGEARYRNSDPQHSASNSIPADKLDSDQESLGHSDVDDLVRWVNRREGTNMRPDAEIQPRAKRQEEGVPSTQHDRERRASSSNASTESDSDIETRTRQRKATMNDDDVDELVRWVSRREGPNAGPVRSNNSTSPSKAVGTLNSSTELHSSGSGHGDDNTAELIRWVKRTDDTSGESLDEVPHPKGGDKNTGSRLRDEVSQQADDKAGVGSLGKTGTRDRAGSGASLSQGDVDELVRWVSRKHNET